MAIFGARKAAAAPSGLASSAAGASSTAPLPAGQPGHRTEATGSGAGKPVVLLTKPPAPAPQQPRVYKAEPSASSAASATAAAAVGAAAAAAGAKLVDAAGRWVGALPSKEAVQPDNVRFRVVAAVGRQGAGKSWVLNRLAGRDCFRTQSRTDKEALQHCTTGVEGAFASLGGHRVLLLDTQPVLSASVLVDLAAREGERRGSPSAAAYERDLHLLVFLLGVCDVLLVMEDAETGLGRDLWALLRHAYLVKGGDATVHDTADLLLVRNRADALQTCRAGLDSLQADWVASWRDLVPNSALYPRLAAVQLERLPAAGGDHAGEGAAVSLSQLRRLLLFAACADEPGFWLPPPQVSARGELVFHDDPISCGAADAAAGKRPLAASSRRARAKESGREEANHAAAPEQPVLLPGAALFGAALRGSRGFQAAGTSTGTGTGAGTGVRSERLSQRAWIELAGRVWSRDIPESVHLREFMALYRARQHD